MDKPHVGLLGATSLVGECLIAQLTERGWQVMAFSREAVDSDAVNPRWRHLDVNRPFSAPSAESKAIPWWLCAAPLWVLPTYFPMLEAYGAKRIAALSSTSRFTKSHSRDPEENRLAQRLKESEDQLRTWATRKGIEWIVLRPTLIYGLGKDKNICEIARFIRRFGFFPVFGKAMGLRQPVHAEDVAAACIAALESPRAENRAYDLSGGERLPYREMVARVFAALGRRTRLLPVPLWVYSFGLAIFSRMPRYRHWSSAMAVRMNQDMVFGHQEAARELGFRPRAFRLGETDLPE